MKEFDWEKSVAMGHRPETVAWLKSIHDKLTTFEQYAEGYRSFRVNDTRPKKNRRYSTSTLRHRYKHLVSDFGFFK